MDKQIDRPPLPGKNMQEHVEEQKLEDRLCEVYV